MRPRYLCMWRKDKSFTAVSQLILPFITAFAPSSLTSLFPDWLLNIPKQSSISLRKTQGSTFPRKKLRPLTIHSQRLLWVTERDSPVHLTLTSSKSILWCSAAAWQLSLMVEKNAPASVFLAFTGYNPLTSLCILPVAILLRRPLVPGRGPWGIADWHSVHLLVLCATCLRNFPTLVGSTHQSAPQPHHWDSL